MSHRCIAPALTALLFLSVAPSDAHEPTIHGATIKAVVGERVTVANMMSLNAGAVPCGCQEILPSSDHKYMVTYQDGRELGPVHIVDITYEIGAIGADVYSAQVWVVDLDNGGTSEIGEHIDLATKVGSFRAFLGPGRYAMYLEHVTAGSTSTHEHTREMSHTAELERGAMDIVDVGKAP